MLTYGELIELVARLTQSYPELYGYTEVYDLQQSVYLVFKSRSDSFEPSRAIARLYYYHEG